MWVDAVKGLKPLSDVQEAVVQICRPRYYLVTEVSSTYVIFVTSHEHQ